ncbi:MAG: hypothetical protein QOC96_1171 [Acidobacteriota bacterium]|jgi:hypothetical protein|nr:hypothetical protein [Acidobacteriota bacterium]
MPKRFLIALLFLLLLFFPLLWISQYNYPSGEDYLIALQARRLGALGATKWWYFSGAGRYSYLFLQSLISLSNSWLTIYKVFPVALLIAGFGSLYYFVKALFGPAFSKTTRFILSATIYTLLISLTPDIATGFYWLDTSIQYAGAVFTSLLIFALFINLCRTKKSLIRMSYALLMTILIALLAGLNEVSVLLVIATFGLINFLYLIEFKRLHTWSLAFLALSIMFGLVSFLAPGTQARIAEVGAEFHLLNVLAGAIGLTFYLLIDLLTSTPLLPASIIYLAFLSANRDKLERLSSLLRRVRWHWILLFMLLSITAINFVIFTAVGVNSLTDRLKNIYVYSIFFGWLLLLTALFFDLSRKKVHLSVPHWISGVLVACIVGFLLTGYKLELGGTNIIPSSSRSQRFFSQIKTKSVYANAYLDLLSGRAERFSRQNEERERQLLNATGDTVEFPLYSYVPATIFIQDVNHPFGDPEWQSAFICGQVKHLNYVETGPPPPPKEKF